MHLSRTRTSDLSNFRLELTSGEGCRSIVKIDEKFCAETSKAIQAGHDVVVKVVLPKPKPDEKVSAAFFRKSRRKTFDLSICNAAFVARVVDNKISSVDVVFGGTDHTLTNAATDGPAVAKNTIKALTGESICNLVIIVSYTNRDLVFYWLI